ncbi:unnamed protein product [Cercospora beticola]|nr:unnamed protein product [Cercospora beticola]
MAKRQSLPHWLVPTTLLVSFIAGIALAVGHHYFYSRLHDRRVDQARWPQGTYVAIGTGRAFLVRAAFVITISTVYWQIFWQRLRKPLSLSTIDDLADQLKVIYQLFNWISLKASPLLGLLALLAWLIPLAVVFPPSALRVVPKEFRSHGIKEIHLPGYNKRDMFVNTYMLAKDQPTVMRGGGYDFDAEWAGPTNRIRRTLFGAAYQGQLPSIPAPQANSSYDITFYAPSIQCMPISSPNEILRELDVAGIQCLNGSTACGTTFSTFHVSWVAESSIVPFNITSSLEDASLGIAEYVPFPYQDYVLPSDARLGTDDSRPQALYLAYRDNMAQKGLHSNDVALLNCMLYNATYTVSFNCNNGNQDVSINAIELQNVIFIESSRDRASCPGAFGLNTPEVQSYLAYMEVVGELLLGMLFSGDLPRIDKTHILETELAFTEELYPLYASYSKSSTTPRPLRPS